MPLIPQRQSIVIVLDGKVDRPKSRTLERLWGSQPAPRRPSDEGGDQWDFQSPPGAVLVRPQGARLHRIEVLEIAPPQTDWSRIARIAKELLPPGRSPKPTSVGVNYVGVLLGGTQNPLQPLLDSKAATALIGGSAPPRALRVTFSAPGPLADATAQLDIEEGRLEAPGSLFAYNTRMNISINVGSKAALARVLRRETLEKLARYADDLYARIEGGTP